MNIDEIETRIGVLEAAIGKIKELVADMRICNSDITKTLISSALKKYATTIADFKLD